MIRPLRALRVITVISVLNRQLRDDARGRIAIYVGATVALVAFVAALAVLEAERNAPDATITTFGEALWWTITTLSTVGYGYRYPVAAPVYVQRPYVAVPPRAEFYAPPPRAEFYAAPSHLTQAELRSQRYTLSARELFEFDRADLRMPQPKLDEIAAALKQNPQVAHVTITGHTDRLGAEAYNQKLSERRAQAVKQYLVEKGVAPARLDAVGRGESQPVVQCHDPAQSALIKCLEPNRRVEVEQITLEQRHAARPGNRAR